MDFTRQYGREDINYETWYSDWMKLLARTKTRAEIETLLGVKTVEAKKAGLAHLRTIEKAHSMLGNSSRKAAARNVVAAAGDYKLALAGALEIYDLFPEHTLEAKQGQ